MTCMKLIKGSIVNNSLSENSFTPISNKKKTLGLILIGVAFLILMITLYLDKENHFLHLILLITTVCISAISIGIFWNYKDKGDENKNNNNGTPLNDLRIFISVTTALYAIIAGFAITEAVRYAFTDFGVQYNFPILISIEIMDLLLKEVIKLKDQFIITGIFLVTAIPFYHGAMMYLTNKGGIVASEKKIGQIIHFAGLFSQSIIFLGISVSLTSSPSVISLIALLLIVDSVWIIAGQFTKHRPPLGWLGLNILFVSLINLSHYPFGTEHALLMILIFASGRTIIDYLGFQKIFFK